MKIVRPRFTLLLLLCGLIPLLGCFGPKGPTMYPVAGEVTMEGEPIAEGKIIFEPFEPDGTLPAFGNITQGKYSFEVEPGDKRVRITAEREVGEVDPAMGARRRENYIPKQYNAKSQLTATVTTDPETNVFPFVLEAK